MTSWLNINSPSKRARDVLGKNWALGIGEGFEDNMPDTDMLSTIKDTMSDMNGELSTVSRPVASRADNVAEIVEAIERLHDAIMNMGIVMDSGEFVGSVHEKMDSTLGREALRAAWQ